MTVNDMTPIVGTFLTTSGQSTWEETKIIIYNEIDKPVFEFNDI